MAKKKTTETPDEGVLVSAAKAIGKAAGQMAKAVGVAPEAPEPKKSQKVPKFAKKDKHRLPRREKKALQKSSK